MVATMRLMLRRRLVLPLIDARSDVTYYYICLALAAAWFVLTFCLVRFAVRHRAVGLRQNERRMIAIGIAPYVTVWSRSSSPARVPVSQAR